MSEFKVAVTAWELAASGGASELAAQAKIAEAIGFDSFWIPESHFNGAASIPSPLMLLAAIAADTSRIRLGSTSYLLPIRHPIQAAEEVAVLDRLSNGRVILGVGRGFQDTMFVVFDVPIKEKRKRFKVSLDLMMHAWRGGAIAEDARGEPVYLSPLPLQKPHPPVWVAAFGPLAIKQAGTLGLPYISSPVEPLSVLASNYRAHQSHAANAGHATINTIPVMRTLFISDNPKTVQSIRTSLNKEASHRMRTDATRADQWAIIGDRAYVTDKLAEYKETIGLNYLIARGRIAGVSSTAQIKSHETLAQITNL